MIIDNISSDCMFAFHTNTIKYIQHDKQTYGDGHLLKILHSIITTAYTRKKYFLKRQVINYFTQIVLFQVEYF